MKIEIKFENDSFKDSLAVKNSNSALTYLKIEGEILDIETYKKLISKIEEIENLLN